MNQNRKLLLEHQLKNGCLKPEVIDLQVSREVSLEILANPGLLGTYERSQIIRKHKTKLQELPIDTINFIFHH